MSDNELVNYDIRSINGFEFNDYRNLKENPFYLKLDEKNKNKSGTLENVWGFNIAFGVSMIDKPSEGYVKIDSLAELATELKKRENAWVFDNKWKTRAKYIQAVLYP